jgi:hypothetical protein
LTCWFSRVTLPDKWRVDVGSTWVGAADEDEGIGVAPASEGENSVCPGRGCVGQRSAAGRQAPGRHSLASHLGDLNRQVGADPMRVGRAG